MIEAGRAPLTQETDRFQQLPAVTADFAAGGCRHLPSLSFHGDRLTEYPGPQRRRAMTNFVTLGAVSIEMSASWSSAATR